MPRREYTSAGQDDAVSTEGLTFTVDGVEFECHGRISAFDLSEFAGPASDAGDDVLDPGVMRILSDLMRAVLGDQTYRELRRHTRKHRTPDGVIQQILMDLTEDAVNRPSAAPSQSPAGPPATAPASSAAVSPSPAGGRGRRQPQDHLPARQPARRGRAAAPAPAGSGRTPAELVALAGAEGNVRYVQSATPGAPRPPRTLPPVIRHISPAGVTTEPIPAGQTAG